MMLTIRNANVKDKKVLLRVDYNLPLDENGKPSDSARILATIPTIEWLLRHGAMQVIIITHWGRPVLTKQSGPTVSEKDKWSLKIIASELAKILKHKQLVKAGRVVSQKTDGKSPVVSNRFYIGKSITMLENLRFDKGEESNDSKFARILAEEAEMYINDAFSASHRQHASLVAITKYLPAYAGLQLLDELKHLQPVLLNQKKPFVAIIGGAKIKDKIPVINMLRKKADTILVGGKTANEYFVAMTEPVDKLVFPTDGVDKQGRIVPYTKNVIASTPPFDIGPDTIVRFKSVIKNAKTLFWNGSLGMAEKMRFRHGSNEIARFVSNLRATTIISGGDTAQIIDNLNLRRNFSFVSTGGGASSEYLIGKKLPGLTALEENANNQSTAFKRSAPK